MGIKHFIGLDLSVSSTGVVILDELGELVLSKAIVVKSLGSTWRDRVQRNLRIWNQLDTLISTHVLYSTIQAVLIEDYAPRYMGSAIPIIELGGLVRENLLGISNLHVDCIPPTVVKKFITGAGNAGKIEVATRLTKDYNVMFKSDDLYDAFGIAQFARALTGYGDWTKAQLEVVNKWKNRV